MIPRPVEDDPKNMWKCRSQQAIPCPEKFEYDYDDPDNLWKCVPRPIIRPEPYDFPEWFSNNPKNLRKSGSWEEYTNAADQLKVVKSDEGFYSLQRRQDSSSFTSCHVDLVRSEFRLYKGCDKKEFVIPYSKITKTDIKNFLLSLDEAERDLQLFEVYFSPDGEEAMLQHDSTVENVMEQLPVRYINNTEGPWFRPFLESLISMAKEQHEKELYRDYTLFIADCDLINTTFEECLGMLRDDPYLVAKKFLGMLKDDPHFVDKKFEDLDYFLLEQGMLMYLVYRDGPGHTISNYKARMEQDYQWERDTMWEVRSRLPPELMTPIHFLAFQKRHKGYNVRHPVKEIMKCRSYFGVFLEGVPPSWFPKPQSPEPWSPEPSQVGSSPSLERPKKRVCHCRT